MHGYGAAGSSFNTMMSRFRADGWTDAELNTWSYDSSKSNVTTAALVRDRVNGILAATGNSKVDIVTWSMGGLSSRYYLKNLGGTARVDEWVSLAGPNHGTLGAYRCSTPACVEMRPGSSFINRLNAGDDTPGAVRYGTWWSWCDGVVHPATSTPLSGATNRNPGCISHEGFLTNATVYGQVRDFVR